MATLHTESRIAREYNLSKRYKSCHNSLRNIDGMQPSEALDELILYITCRDVLDSRQSVPGSQLGLMDISNTESSDTDIAMLFRDIASHELAEKLAARDFESDRVMFRSSDKALAAMHDGMSDISFSEIPFDVRSAALHEFIDPRSRKSTGVFLTPTVVTDLAVNPLPLFASASVIDPACGSGSFLSTAIAAIEARFNESSYSATGVDINERMIRISRSTFGELVGSSISFTNQDFLSVNTDNDAIKNLGSFDFAMTNPPFGVKIPVTEKLKAQYKLVDLYPTSKNVPSELLFMERIASILQPSGWFSVVLPISFMTNRSFDKARQFLGEMLTLKAVAILPSETFAVAGTQTNTCIVYGQKVGSVAPDTRTSVGIFRINNIGHDSTGRSRSNADVNSTTDQIARFIESEQISGDHNVVSCGGSTTFQVMTTDRAANAGSNGSKTQPLSDFISAARVGRTPARSAYSEDGVFVLKVGNLTDRGINWSPRARNFVHPNKTTERFKVQLGDIVLTSTAHNPSYIAAKIDVIDRIPDWLTEGVTYSAELLLLRPAIGCDPFELIAALRTPAAREQFRHLITGQTAHLKANDAVTVHIDISVVTNELTELLREESAVSQRSSEIAHRRSAYYSAWSNS